MKKLFLSLGLFMYAMFLFSPQVADADAKHWVDEYYNFKNIKSILIICSIPEEVKDDVYNPYLPITYPKEIMTILQKKRPSLTVHTLVEATELLNQKTDGEYTRLLSSNNPEAAALLKQFIADNYDAAINVKFLEYNYIYSSVLANSRPWQRPNVHIDFSITDAKRGAIIFGRNEQRSGDGVSTFAGISTRLANKFTDNLIQLMENTTKEK